MADRFRLLLYILFWVVLTPITSSACNEQQTITYVTQVLFGYNASKYQLDDSTKMLLDALYLCSEQSDGSGQEKIEYLKSKRVLGLPSLSELDIEGQYLNQCAHIKWENIYLGNPKTRNSRKQLLQYTVNTVFDFGFSEELFGKVSEKSNSFAALLYYSHILADYLADNPAETEIDLFEYHVPQYDGEACKALNGNKPTFSENQLQSKESHIEYSYLDSLGRAGMVFGNIGPDMLQNNQSRSDIYKIKPSGWWNLNSYEGMVISDRVYNRCHLMAHMLGGVEERTNLVTCTEYLNQISMLNYEKMVSNYIAQTGNHVLYRVTPFFKGDNKLISGIQMEAYSVEDMGEGILFNVYCYNVQPGIRLNYFNGHNEKADMTFGDDNIIPFATINQNATNSDLISEISNHLSILFKDQKNSNIYVIMMGQINSIASEARNIVGQGGNSALKYIALNASKYKLFDVLKEYIPLLLMNEPFFQSAFN